MCRLSSCLLLLILLIANAAFANGAQASGRYLDLHKVVEPVTNLEGLRYVRADMRMTSKDAKVRPEAIVLTIRTASGDIRVPVDAEGRFSLPISRALVEENPEVITNQPDDTLQVQVGVEVRAEPRRTFDYALLGEMSDEYGKVVGSQKLMTRLFAPSDKGLLIRFPKGSDATVTIALANGSVVRYAADDRDEVHLPHRSEWKRDNPRIELSAQPEKVMLDLNG